MVGLAGFEPASIAPEATSLDQASRQPRFAGWTVFFLLDGKIKIAMRLQEAGAAFEKWPVCGGLHNQPAT
jgi:hypothetical protein